jgi:hypothetical protein
VGAPRNDFAVLKHQNQVGSAQGTQALGDHKRGATLHQHFERLLDLPLGLRINAGGGIIQNQDARVIEQGTRNCYTLALAAR